MNDNLINFYATSNNEFYEFCQLIRYLRKQSLSFEMRVVIDTCKLKAKKLHNDNINEVVKSYLKYTYDCTLCEFVQYSPDGFVTSIPQFCSLPTNLMILILNYRTFTLIPNYTSLTFKYMTQDSHSVIKCRVARMSKSQIQIRDIDTRKILTMTYVQFLEGCLKYTETSTDANDTSEYDQYMKYYQLTDKSQIEEIESKLIRNKFKCSFSKYISETAVTLPIYLFLNLTERTYKYTIRRPNTDFIVANFEEINNSINAILKSLHDDVMLGQLIDMRISDNLIQANREQSIDDVIEDMLGVKNKTVTNHEPISISNDVITVKSWTNVKGEVINITE